MTKDEQQRPSDPLTAADAAQIMGAFENMKKSVNERIDGIVLEVQNIRSTVSIFTADLASSRDTRVNSEVSELGKERKILEQRLGIIDEKLESKKSEKSTSESQRMRAIAATSYEEREMLQKEAWSKWWRETFQLAGRAIIIGTAVTTSAGIIGAIGWFILFYINNR